MEEKELYVAVGDIINYQHTNMWGNLCGNWHDYLVTGKEGKYGEGYKYRLTQIGDGSVYSDKIPDIFIKSTDMVVGKNTLYGKIHSHTKKWKEGN